MNPEHEHRALLTAARRVVIKLGTRVLVRADGRPHAARLRALVREMAALRRAGREVAVVTSGAIGAGMEALGWTRRPTHLPELQMAAAVGQSRLMSRYEKAFAAERCQVGQVLLTHDALKARHRHLTARNTLMTLLRHGIIPIINENDAVAVEEIKFGDNDLLAALVALLLDADLLVLLTTVDGLRAPAAAGRTRRLPCLEAVTRRELALAFGKGGELSTGGMASKLQSAQTVVRAGTPVVIADGRRAGILAAICRGDDVGTLIGRPGRARAWDARRRWIAYFHKPQGAVVVDAGARRALVERGVSLLPIGIQAVEGSFRAGATVDIRALDGALIGRGLASYGSDDLRRLRGHRSADFAARVGACDFEEAIHRDNLVMFEPSSETAP